MSLVPLKGRLESREHVIFSKAPGRSSGSSESEREKVPYLQMRAHRKWKRVQMAGKREPEQLCIVGKRNNIHECKLAPLYCA